MHIITDTDALKRIENVRRTGKFAPVLADFMKAVTDHADAEYPTATEIVGDYALGADEAYTYRLRKIYGGWAINHFEASRTRFSENVKGLRYLEAMVVLEGMKIREIFADLHDDQPMPEDVVEGAPKRLVAGRLREFRARDITPAPAPVTRPSLWARFLAFFQKERAA